MTLRDRLLLATARYGLLEPGDRVLVAVSGGQDSVALLHLLATLEPSWALQLIVAHLHHGLRGVEADADQAAVIQMAERLGLPCVTASADIPALAREARVGLEVAGRKARYEFFQRAAAAHDCARVALGHTASDRAESLLLNLLRGAGVAGMASIPPRRGIFRRPLILATRQETGDYCRSQGLEVRHDRTNEDLRLRRNWVRLHLLPQLAQEFGPSVVEALSRAAEHLDQELDWTAPLVAEAYGQCATTAGLDAAAVSSLAPGLAHRVWERFLQDGGHPLTDIAAERWDALQRFARTGATGKRMELGAGWSVQQEYGVLRLTTAEPAQPVWTEEVALTVPGWVPLPDGRRVEATLTAVAPAEEEATVLDADQTGPRLILRLPRLGDRFQPSGMTGHKKLQDYFVDAKVPRRERQPLVVCAAEGEILALAGHRRAQRACPGPDTRNYLVLRVHPPQEPRAARPD